MSETARIEHDFIKPKFRLYDKVFILDMERVEKIIDVFDNSYLKNTIKMFIQEGHINEIKAKIHKGVDRIFYGVCTYNSVGYENEHIAEESFVDYSKERLVERAYNIFCEHFDHIRRNPFEKPDDSNEN